GSGGLGAVRAYLRNLSPDNVAVSVEDRDYYRTQAEAHAGWGNLTAHGFFWRRHEIENYLLHPRVVLALFDDLRAPGFGWATALPATEADASPCSRRLQFRYLKITRRKCCESNSCATRPQEAISSSVRSGLQPHREPLSRGRLPGSMRSSKKRLAL